MQQPFWKDKVAIVTGASAGLGRAIADAWAAAGARVVLAARGAEALEAAAAEIRAKHGVDVLAVPTDVTRDADVAALVERTIAAYGRVDVLVNNAGRSMRRALRDTTPDDFRELFDLNVIAAVRTTRAALPHLLAARGHLVNIASLAGKAPARYMGAYGPTKAALVSYTHQLRLELVSQGLHVLLVSPGPIVRDTPRVYSEAERASVPAEFLKPGGGVKTQEIAADWLARRTLRACERREVDLTVPVAARMLLAIMQLSPWLGDAILRRST